MFESTKTNHTKVNRRSKRATAAPVLSGAEAVIRSLLAEGVSTIFGYPGGAIMPVYDALYDHRAQLQHILTRHGQGYLLKS